MHLLRAATNKVSRLVSPRDEEEAADDENVDDTNDGRGFALDAGRTGVESRTTRTTTGRTATTSFASSAERCCFESSQDDVVAFSSRSFHQRKGSVRKRKKSKSSNRDDDDDDDDVKDVMFDETQRMSSGWRNS